MSAKPSAQPDIHLFEPTGYAGVFQHTCRLAQALSQRGLTVTLHTGHEHEPVDLAGVRICSCVWWPMPRDTSRPKVLMRKAAITAGLVARTVPPHLIHAGSGAVLHVQGVSASGAVNLLLLAAARRAGSRVVYSPHDVFSRRGALDEFLLRIGYRRPHAMVVYSDADARILAKSGVAAHVSPLVQLVPPPTALQRRIWRREWGRTRLRHRCTLHRLHPA